ncbi:hypothetical protein [Lentzea kentuckyensis]|uniref:hypothetical protein n=1 Tax=Lentzea kentuckyensis TaxID=360086 RepID=UPI00117BCFE3|nr:hypothetical protein [Lentzea kentuckyensis]
MILTDAAGEHLIPANPIRRYHRRGRRASTAMTASGCGRRSCQLTQQSDCSVAISAGGTR